MRDKKDALEEEVKHLKTREGENNVSWLLLSIVFVIFFPLIPTILYFGVLFRRHKQQTNKQKLSYMETEERANEVKSITGVIESPIQLIIMFWLMLKGCILIGY